MEGDDQTYGGHSYGASFSRAGRLVTTSFDGFVRLYDLSGGTLRLLTKRQIAGEKQAYGAKEGPVTLPPPLARVED